MDRPPDADKFKYLIRASGARTCRPSTLIGLMFSFLLLLTYIVWSSRLRISNIEDPSTGILQSKIIPLASINRYEPTLYIPTSSRWNYLPEKLEHLTKNVLIPPTRIVIVLNLDNDDAVRETEKLCEKKGVQMLWHKPEINGKTSMEMMTHSFYKMFRHAFETRQDNFAIFLEDDLLVSFDFYQYFKAAARLMDVDQTVFCASGWSDNGYFGLSSDEGVFMRGQHFMGLGWMMSRASYERYLKERVDQLFSSQNFRFEWENAIRTIMAKHRELECVFPEVSRTHHTILDQSKAYSVSATQQKYRFDLMRLASLQGPQHILELSSLNKAAYDDFIVGFIRSAIEITNIDDAYEYKNAELIFKCSNCDTSMRMGWQILEEKFGMYSFGAVETIVRGVYEETVFVRVATNRLLIVGSRSSFLKHHHENSNHFLRSSYSIDINNDFETELADIGVSCTEHCRGKSKICYERWLAYLNGCSRLEKVLSQCQSCVKIGEDSAQPSVDQHGVCHVTADRLLNCEEKPSTDSRRICVCK